MIRHSMTNTRSTKTKKTAAPNEVHPQALAATWLLRVIDMGLTDADSDFFTCAGWACGGLQALVSRYDKELSAKGGRKKVSLRSDVHDLTKCSQRRLPEALEDFLIDYPEATATLNRYLSDMLQDVSKTIEAPSSEAELIQQFFGLSDEATRLCEYAFMASNNRPISQYFEQILDLEESHNRRQLAQMLNINHAHCRGIVTELTELGILDENEDLRLTPSVENALIEGCDTRLQKQFCMPLSGETLPLEQFRIPRESCEDIVRLLQNDSEESLQILLYGKPGVGKSTFVHSVAHKLNMRAWSVPCRANDTIEDRRIALLACTRLARQNKNSFIVVDEAEHFFDTETETEKVWLNKFLEEPGQRIIWITNNIKKIDQSVRRRFNYSIHFPDLDTNDRQETWRQLVQRLQLEKRISENDVKMLSCRYPVQAAVIENALKQARVIAPNKGFVPCVERILKAHMTLKTGGKIFHSCWKGTNDYSLDCLCTEKPIEDLLTKCRKLDTALRKDINAVAPRMGTMLFYGPPGTGKSELAKYIASELGRECQLKRASNLLSPYVGETEQNIAAAFTSAENKGAILVIDEVDSFLQARTSGQHSWERTQVNEFLTALENYVGFCICTTNLYKDIDPGIVRRFTHKIRFNYAKPSQLKNLYEKILIPMVDEAPDDSIWETLLRQHYLTPGDFSAVRNQYALEDHGSYNHNDLLNALIQEQKMKLDTDMKRIGFAN